MPKHQLILWLGLHCYDVDRQIPDIHCSNCLKEVSHVRAPIQPGAEEVHGVSFLHTQSSPNPREHIRVGSGPQHVNPILTLAEHRLCRRHHCTGPRPGAPDSMALRSELDEIEFALRRQVRIEEPFQRSLDEIQMVSHSSECIHNDYRSETFDLAEGVLIRFFDEIFGLVHLVVLIGKQCRSQLGGLLPVLDHRGEPLHGSSQVVLPGPGLLYTPFRELLKIH
mmetsp:Transcript_10057/g.22174  ORF Transcript_10057/g.22174 Transcript_10057/m.22174 type:complete len:223 (-) Transcript_10057:739-1407(-)